jgi:hypothetical protein
MANIYIFKIPGVNVIESDDGFSVEVLGMTGMRYIEGDKTFFIDIELLMGNPGRMLGIEWQNFGSRALTRIGDS